MQRFFENKLKLWYKKPRHLPLMVVGARQIGKTYILKKFCSEYFVEQPEYKQFFLHSLNPREIVSRIELFFNKKIDLKKTVLFFDEIQDCEEAIASLKFFAESDEKYHIVSAGSLLGVKINRMKAAFPVGKIQLEYLYPMDFEEFIWAIGEKMLAEEIRKCYVADSALPAIIHNKALLLYRIYLCIGGMPASISEFVQNGKDLLLFDRQIIADILTGYLADMAKYAEEINAAKIHQVYRSMPAQLAKENTKFTYKLVEKGGNREKYQSAIDWLTQANMLLPCVKIETPQSPLSAYLTDNIFKLYLSDIGFLVSLSRMNFNEIIQEEKLIYRGFLTENFVAQTFVTHGFDLYFWNSKHLAEMDFVLNLQDGIIPVEVKASDNVRSKSLKVYMEKYQPKYAIRISARNFGFDNNIKSVPLYAVHCIS